MSLDLLKQDIDTASFRRIYYLYGPEPYLKRFYLNTLLKAILPENKDTDLHRYEGKNMEVQGFSEELWLCPMGAYKVLLIYDLPMSSPVCQLLSEEDCEIGTDTVVIIYQQTEDPDQRTNSFKLLKKRLEKDGLLVEIKTVDDATLSRWVVQQFQRRGCTIAPAEVNYFLSAEDRNMESMLTEIDKISVYCDGVVTLDALEKLCVKTVQARAFELCDLILQKNGDRVFSVWRDLRALRTPPQMILGTLFGCFSGLYKLKLTESLSEKEREETTGLKPYQMRKYLRYLPRIPVANLERLMDCCAKIDLLSKTSNTDPDLLVVWLLNEGLECL